MKQLTILILSLLVVLTGCENFPSYEKDVNVGMLVETTVQDNAWSQQGLEGLQAIHDEFGADIFYKEGINTFSQTAQAVEELAQQGMELVFGHSSVYGSYFRKLHDQYPEITFVYFNGDFTAENVASMNFDSRAMGFFAGMIAGKMTESNQVGLIGVFEWQPEIEGFYEGVMYENPRADVDIALTNSWENKKRARSYYQTMAENGADVFYAAGDSFNKAIIKEAQQDGNYAIGYVKDQSSVAEQTVLTSTVQRVDYVYEVAMERYLEGSLQGKSIPFDFQEGAIQMGEYSPAVPEPYKNKIQQAVHRYMETGKLPQ